MHGKVVIVTGSNTGIGKVTARRLAKDGATLVMACRNRERGEAARQEILAAHPGVRVELMVVDLGSLQSVRDFTAAFCDTYERLDVLVNNAGLMVFERSTTADGFESTFGINHLGTFLLTNLLLDVLRATAGARVVTVSSAVHKYGRINFEDLQMERGFNGPRAYSNSKLANLLFAFELARRLDGSDVTSNALHPGAVGTDFLREMPKFLRRFGPYVLSTPEQGAQTTIHLASSPDVADVSGEYFKKSRKARCSRKARDLDVAKKLWDLSASLSGL